MDGDLAGLSISPLVLSFNLLATAFGMRWIRGNSERMIEFVYLYYVKSMINASGQLPIDSA